MFYITLKPIYFISLLRRPLHTIVGDTQFSRQCRSSGVVHWRVVLLFRILSFFFYNAKDEYNKMVSDKSMVALETPWRRHPGWTSPIVPTHTHIIIIISCGQYPLIYFQIILWKGTPLLMTARFWNVLVVVGGSGVTIVVICPEIRFLGSKCSCRPLNGI